MPRRSSGSGRAEIGVPSMTSSPDDGATSPLITFSAVVFPAPLRPRYATRSPVPMRSETRSRIAFAPAVTVTSRYSITSLSYAATPLFGVRGTGYGVRASSPGRTGATHSRAVQAQKLRSQVPNPEPRTPNPESGEAANDQ